MEAIRLESLSYFLDEKAILDNISLEIEKGQFVGLIGPNGAGKTTLLKNINRVKNGRGKIFFFGKNSDDMEEKTLARQVALMKQDTEVGFPFSCFEVVLMGRYPHLDWTKQEKEQDRQIARNYMEYTNTWSLAQKSVTAISGGERQRIMFAKVLTQETPIILLDEPTSNLDIAHQEQIFRYGQEFCQKGGTILAAVHDLRVAAKYCTHLILLHQGRTVAQGSPAEVLTKENLKKAYGLDCLVYCNKSTGEWDIYLPSHLGEEKGRKIHLIGGGGRATFLLRELYQEGYDLSLGVVAQGDSDTETARIFSVPAVVNPPFAPISSDFAEENKQMIEASHWTILCSVPFGKDNLLNLKAAAQAKNLLIVEDQPIEERDFTQGEATEIYNSLKERAVVLSSHEVTEFLKKQGREKNAFKDSFHRG